MKNQPGTKKKAWNYKDQPRTVNHPQNPPGSMKNQPGTLKETKKKRHESMKILTGTLKTMKTHLEP